MSSCDDFKMSELDTDDSEVSQQVTGVNEPRDISLNESSSIPASQ